MLEALQGKRPPINHRHGPVVGHTAELPERKTRRGLRPQRSAVPLSVAALCGRKWAGLSRGGRGGRALKQPAENCDPSFNSETGERSAARLIADAIARKHSNWITWKGTARGFRQDLRGSIDCRSDALFARCLLLALSHHDVSPQQPTQHPKERRPPRHIHVRIVMRELRATAPDRVALLAPFAEHSRPAAG
jgi:hypothetical protein